MQLESKGVIKQMTPKLKGWIFLKTGNKGLLGGLERKEGGRVRVRFGNATLGELMKTPPVAHYSR